MTLVQVSAFGRPFGGTGLVSGRSIISRFCAGDGRRLWPATAGA